MKRLILIALIVVLASTAYACNIPVFRYALERWQPDTCELIVFHDAEFSSRDQEFVAKLKSEVGDKDGMANANLVVSKVEDMNESYQHVWETLRDEQGASLPYVVVRTKLGRGTTINHWHGSLGAARSANLLRSPVRKELNRRLVRGDSIVWLLLQSPDNKRTQAAKKLLNQTFKTLKTKVSLPEGIGLPGSELHSEVPLLVQFSVLEIDPSDDQEQFLVQLLTGFEPRAVSDGEPILVPVFGRGRALEVIPARDLDSRLIEDVTLFLSAACSCQVKAQNPGFDLLMTADWDTQLFGEDGQRPPPAKVADPNRPPELLTLPPGR